MFENMLSTMDDNKPASFKVRPRVSSFLTPATNPFIHKLVLTRCQKIQFAIMTITAAPIKLFVACIFLLLTWAFARTFTIRMKIPCEKPISGFRYQLFRIVRLTARVVFFIIGFHCIRVRGKRATAKEAPITVVAPHSSPMDVLMLYISDPMPSGVSRTENIQAPILGTIGISTQPVFVSRHDPDSRRKAIDEINKRVSIPGKWPQIVIFPEGTCTNRKALITFKAGAFIPGSAVQPVLIEYLNALDTFTWTMRGPNGWKVLWYTLCQFSVKVRVTYLPVYHPSQEEKNNPHLYARNVRSLMAYGLNVPCTDHTFEDCRLMRQASLLNLPMEAGLIEFAKISQKLGMDLNCVQDKLEAFSKIACERSDGVVSLKGFSKLLNMPISDAVKDMFHLYDRSDSGFIDFREYVIGLSLVSQPAATEETVKLAFKVFDKDHDGIVSKDEFIRALYAVFENEFSGNEIFEDIKKSSPDGITFEEFHVFMLNKPEYAKLFIWYKEMVSDFNADLESTYSSRSFGSRLSYKKIRKFTSEEDSFIARRI